MTPERIAAAQALLASPDYNSTKPAPPDLVPDDAPPPEAPPEDEPAPRSKSVPAAEALFAIAKSRYNLGITPDGAAFAVAKPGHGPHVARSLRGAPSLTAELAAIYAEEVGKIPSASACTDALNAIEGLCQRAVPTPLALRVAGHNGGIVIDLGDASGRVAVVTADGWRIEDRSPVLFRRTRLTGALPTPERGASLDELRGLLNVTAESWPLLVGYLVSCLVPDIPHPIGLLTGEHGTGKSTAAETIVGLVDPSPAPLRSAPRNPEEWVVGASASWTVAVDNISTIPPWMSDAFCRAATGEGSVKRALYTNHDVDVLSFRRCVLITSIDAGALRGDLADRLATIELERIPGSKRRTDRALAAALDEARPRIFGALLDLLASVLREMPTITFEELPRMADFMTILGAVDKVTGMNSIEVFTGHAERLAADVVEGDPVAAAVVNFMRQRDTWEGTAGELLGHLIRPEALEKKYWPADGTRASGKVRRAAPALAKLGIDVQDRRTGPRRLLVLTRTVDADTIPQVTDDVLEPF